MSKPSSPMKNKSKKNKARSGWKTALFMLILVGCLIVAAVLRLSLLKPYPVSGATEKLSISTGQTYTSFIHQLEQDKIVRFSIVLKIYRKFFIHDTLKAGVYELRQGMSVREVLEMVSNAENAQMNRILVIEGTTSKQLLNALNKDPLVKSTLNSNTAQTLKQLNIPFDHPEGLFAPNTYFFDKGATDVQILTDLYQRQMKILDDAWEKRAPNLPYKNKYEALIMASIIEKETNIQKEMAKVSGVFIRRLGLGMRLQTDPTVIYGMGDSYQGNITRKDLMTTTAYNTYRINGLPPTPIALPSEQAIHAAMHPDQSDALYFVATGKGGHTFSSNLADHNRAVQDYLAVIRAQKKDQ